MSGYSWRSWHVLLVLFFWRNLTVSPCCVPATLFRFLLLPVLYHTQSCTGQFLLGVHVHWGKFCFICTSPWSLVPHKDPALPRKEIPQSRGRKTKEMESLNSVKGEKANPEMKHLPGVMNSDASRPDRSYGWRKIARYRNGVGCGGPEGQPNSLFSYGNAKPVELGFSRKTGHPYCCARCHDF